jgi:hypothetical protein
MFRVKIVCVRLWFCFINKKQTIVVGGLYSNGNVNIDVYFAPNGGSGFYDAISAAVYSTRLYSTISISWGNPESLWYNSILFLVFFCKWFYSMKTKVTLVGECF